MKLNDFRKWEETQKRQQKQRKAEAEEEAKQKKRAKHNSLPIARTSNILSEKPRPEEEAPTELEPFPRGSSPPTHSGDSAEMDPESDLGEAQVVRTNSLPVQADVSHAETEAAVRLDLPSSSLLRPSVTPCHVTCVTSTLIKSLSFGHSLCFSPRLPLHLY